MANIVASAIVSVTVAMDVIIVVITTDILIVIAITITLSSSTRGEGRAPQTPQRSFQISKGSLLTREMFTLKFLTLDFTNEQGPAGTTRHSSQISRAHGVPRNNPHT